MDLEALSLLSSQVLDALMGAFLYVLLDTLVELYFPGDLLPLL
jgi:hypothetical protein